MMLLIQSRTISKLSKDKLKERRMRLSRTTRLPRRLAVRWNLG